MGRNGSWKPTSKASLTIFSRPTLRFLEHRIGDPNRIRIVHRFLKAGVMEDDVFGGNDEVTHRFFGRALFFTVIFRPFLCDLG